MVVTRIVQVGEMVGKVFIGSYLGTYYIDILKVTGLCKYLRRT